MNTRYLKTLTFVTIAAFGPLLQPTISAAGKKTAKAAKSGSTVELKTNMGTIVIELDAQKAPNTVANFLSYVKKGHYTGTIFHRVISNFMIQGGGFDKALKEKPTSAPIQNEADNGLPNVRGSIAMARTMNPHSAAAQFYINGVDNVSLNHRDKSMQGWGYTVFGKVTRGMDVVDKIKAVETGSQNGMGDVPVKPVVIESAKLVGG